MKYRALRIDVIRKNHIDGVRDTTRISKIFESESDRSSVLIEAVLMSTFAEIRLKSS